MLGMGYEEWPVSLHSVTWNYCVHITGLVWICYFTRPTLWIICITFHVNQFVTVINSVDTDPPLIGNLIENIFS